MLTLAHFLQSTATQPYINDLRMDNFNLNFQGLGLPLRQVLQGGIPYFFKNFNTSGICDTRLPLQRHILQLSLRDFDTTNTLLQGPSFSGANISRFQVIEFLQDQEVGSAMVKAVESSIIVGLWTKVLQLLPEAKNQNSKIPDPSLIVSLLRLKEVADISSSPPHPISLENALLYGTNYGKMLRELRILEVLEDLDSSNMEEFKNFISSYCELESEVGSLRIAVRIVANFGAKFNQGDSQNYKIQDVKDDPQAILDIAQAIRPFYFQAIDELEDQEIVELASIHQLMAIFMVNSRSLVHLETMAILISKVLEFKVKNSETTVLDLGWWMGLSTLWEKLLEEQGYEGLFISANNEERLAILINSIVPRNETNNGVLMEILSCHFISNLYRQWKDNTFCCYNSPIAMALIGLHTQVVGYLSSLPISSLNPDNIPATFKSDSPSPIAKYVTELINNLSS